MSLLLHLQLHLQLVTIRYSIEQGPRDTHRSWAAMHQRYVILLLVVTIALIPFSSGKGNHKRISTQEGDRFSNYFFILIPRPTYP